MRDYQVLFLAARVDDHDNDLDYYPTLKQARAAAAARPHGYSAAVIERVGSQGDRFPVAAYGDSRRLRQWGWVPPAPQPKSVRKPKRPPLPRIDQRAARQLYRAAFGEAMPGGWKVDWTHTRRYQGYCSYGPRTIVLSYHHFGDACKTPSGETAFEVLLHEFIHLRFQQSLRHGPEFNAQVRAACEAVGLPVVRHTNHSLFTGKEYAR